MDFSSLQTRSPKENIPALRKMKLHNFFFFSVGHFALQDLGFSGSLFSIRYSNRITAYDVKCLNYNWPSSLG